MKSALLAAEFGAGLLALLVSGTAFAAAPSRSDLDRIAQKLTTQAAGIKEAELVLIEGAPRDLELLQDLAVQVRKVGAFPLLQVGGDRLTRRLYDDVPEKFDAQEPKLGLRIAESFDAIIGLDDVDDPGNLKHVAPARQLARGAGGMAVAEAMNKRGVRRVYVGNGLYPTPANAQLLGLPRAQLEKLFWESLDVDYGKLTATGEALKAILAAGREVRVTNPNGTDLAVRVEARPIYVSDGVISEDKARQGGAATQVWLPAGEVYLVPVAGTAEGTVVADRMLYENKVVEGLTMTFKAGKMTSMKARRNAERFQATYEAADARKDEFAFIDFGINSRAKSAKGLLSYIPAGMITVGIGGNVWAGGDNRVPFGTALYLPGSTATVDGVTFIEKGRLNFPQAAAAR
jgi:leucyl aminopeptidase (aminopeptidase T)